MLTGLSKNVKLWPKDVNVMPSAVDAWLAIVKAWGHSNLGLTYVCVCVCVCNDPNMGSVIRY